MSALIDVFVKRNPLLAHGPRTHATGIELATTAPGTVRRRAHRRWDVDAPRVHLGHAGRA